VDAQLFAADDNDPASTINSYLHSLKKSADGHRNCRDLVQGYMKKGYDIVIPQKTLIAQTVSVAPASSNASATCGTSATSPSATAKNAAILTTPTKNSTTPTTEKETAPTPQVDATTDTSAPPLSGCININVPGIITLNAQGVGGSVYKNTVSGATIAIVPADLPDNFGK